MKRLWIALAAVALMSDQALAAPPAGGGGGPTNTAVYGYDVSYPQCGMKLPSGQQFGVVGVNGGLANKVNPCLAAELAWAQGSKGGTAQPAASVYVNTGNPGDVTPAVADWPASGTSPFYGACNGTDSAACAYVYGQQRAAQDVSWAQGAGLAMAGSHWWLDVETMNSWSSNQAANAADLEGMTDTLRLAGAVVGIYSTNYQWGQIAGNYDGVGSYPNEGTLNGQSDWFAGATSLAGAQANCAVYTPFTTGGIAAMAQYVPHGAKIDSDYSCQ